MQAGNVPDALRELLSPFSRLLPWLFGEGVIEIGPIPAGTPVGLLSNLDLYPESAEPREKLAHDAKLLALLGRMKHDLEALPPTFNHRGN